MCVHIQVGGGLSTPLSPPVYVPETRDSNHLGIAVLNKTVQSFGFHTIKHLGID